MSCQTKPGVKPFLDFIETTTGKKITQADWHDIRQLATQEHVVAWTSENERGIRFGDKLPKSKATAKQVIASIENLKTSLGEDASFPMATRLQSQNVTQGTVHCVNYLARNGVKETVDKVRATRLAKKNCVNTEVSESDPDSVLVAESLEECDWLNNEDVDGIAHQAYEMWPHLSNARDELLLTHAVLDINDLNPATLTSYMFDSDMDGLRHVETLMDDLEAGDEFPPLIVFPQPSGGWWLADGCHRAAALGEFGATKVNVLIAQPQDAVPASTFVFSQTGEQVVKETP